MNYDLEQLGPIGFQDMVSALCVAVFGPSVRRLGAGPDGGRDMESSAAIDWAKAGQNSHGYLEGDTAFQVKHKQTLSAKPIENARWLMLKIREELNAWATDDTGRPEVPETLVFLTNVKLSPNPRGGGLVTVRDFIENQISTLHNPVDSGMTLNADQRLKRSRIRRLKRVEVVDGNQIASWLDDHPGVRQTYAGFFTTGDVLASLVSQAGGTAGGEFDSTIGAHARASLVRERNVYFDEAGGDQGGVPIDKIAIDLPIAIRNDARTAGAIEFTLDRGEHVLRPSETAVAGARHIVLAGSPGNGKTTVSKFLTHAYRASFIQDSGELGKTHRDVIESTQDKLRRLRFGLPRHRRWPIRVDLAAFAKSYVDAARTEPLLAWIANTVSTQGTEGKIAARELRYWMKSWPSFVALDGLDEVTEPGVRAWVIGAIQEFTATLEADNADVLILVTTRPTGYAGELSDEDFTRIDLADLKVPEALAYGEQVARTRLKDDLTRIDRVRRIMFEASANESLRHLLRTPLQVQIMSIIAEGVGSFDPDRYRLFWRYFEVILRREQGKENTRFAELLRENSAQVVSLHERIGLKLQIGSEIASGGTASISAIELNEVAWQVLADDGYDPSGSDSRLLERIVQAATHRLVLITQRGEGFGFDVRSLQELMAARQVSNADTSTIVARLRTLADSPHWRNTWLFAAGRIFSEPKAHEHEAVLSLIENIDKDARGMMSSVLPVGPYLAWDILDDGLAASKPKFMLRLLELALEVVFFPAPQPIDNVGRILVSACELNGDLRELTREKFRAALSDDSRSIANAKVLQRAIEDLGRQKTVSTDVKMLAEVKGKRSYRPKNLDRSYWDDFEETMKELADTDIVGDASLAASLIKKAAMAEDWVEEDYISIERALRDSRVRDLVEFAIEDLKWHEPRIVKMLTTLIQTTLARTQVGHTIAAE